MFVDAEVDYSAVLDCRAEAYSRAATCLNALTCTDTLRGEIRSTRVGELPVFDMGPGLEQLLERCEAETGLPAPKAPVWL
jgi:N-methylhydantoinase B